MEVLAQILRLCKQPTARTRIMYKANMSYSATMKFLEYLQQVQMLKFDENGKKYETTEKGHNYLKKYFDLQKNLNL